MIKRLEKISLEMARRKLYHSVDIKTSLLKSLIVNQNNYYVTKLIYVKKKRFNRRPISPCKQRNLCLITGRTQGVIRLVGFSRQTMKRYA